MWVRSVSIITSKYTKDLTIFFLFVIRISTLVVQSINSAGSWNVASVNAKNIIQRSMVLWLGIIVKII